MTRIVLASASERRSALLRQMGLEFETVVSGVDEEKVPMDKPRAYVRKLGQLKAMEVAGRERDGIIIGCDTTVFLEGKFYAKPRDREDAARFLREMQGKVHTVFSGLCVINKDTGERVSRVVATKVKFRELDDKKIAWYVDTGEPFGKAGGYAIQGKGSMLIEWIDGDYYNVVGLPVEALAVILEKMGIEFKT